MTTEKKSVPGMNGGRREGAGRKKGSPNKRTQATQAKVEATGITPLDFMLKQMRRGYPRGATVQQKIAIDAMKFEAAKAVAPYVHARLASVEHSGKGGGAIITDSTIQIVLVKPGETSAA